MSKLSSGLFTCHVLPLSTAAEAKVNLFNKKYILHEFLVGFLWKAGWNTDLCFFLNQVFGKRHPVVRQKKPRLFWPKVKAAAACGVEDNVLTNNLKRKQWWFKVIFILYINIHNSHEMNLRTWQSKGIKWQEEWEESAKIYPIITNKTLHFHQARLHVCLPTGLSLFLKLEGDLH